MYKTILTIFVILLFNLLTARSQENHRLKATVSDTNGSPLPYASYALFFKDAETAFKGGLVDSAGVLTISQIPQGNYVLKISAIGFQEERKALAVSGDLNVQIVLEQLNNQLEEVTISASRVQPIVQRPDRIIMHVENSVLAAGNNVYDLLTMAPAVSVSGNSVNVQGKSGVLVVLNGKRLPNASLKDLLQAIPGDQIVRIEVITNPSAKYDADASGGVIEIYTKNNAGVDAWSANVAVNAAQGRLLHSGGNAGVLYNKDKVSFNLAGGYSNNGHLEVGGLNRGVFEGRDEVGNIQMDKDLTGRVAVFNIASGFGYQLADNQKIGVELNILNVDLGLDGNLGSRLQTYSPSNTENTPVDMDLGIATALQSVNLTYDIALDSSGSSLDASANYMHYVNRQNQTFLPTGQPEQDVLNEVKANYDILTGMLNYRKIFNQRNIMEIGTKYTNTRNSSRELTSNEQAAESELLVGYDEDIFALYVNYELGITDFLKLQFGVRAENTNFAVENGTDSSYWNVFPKARLDFIASPAYSTSLYYAANINRPNYDLLVPYTRYFDIYTVQVGNPLLRPEYSNTVGWSHRFKGYSVSLEYQHIKDAISNNITYDEGNLFFINKMENFSKRELWSANFSIPFKIVRFWQSFNTLGAFYQLNYIPDPFTQQQVSRKNSYINFKTNNIFTMGKGWDMDLSAFYTGNRLRGIYLDDYISNISFGVRKQLWNKKGFVKFDVSDIFLDQIARWSSDFVPIRMNGVSRNDTRKFRLTVGYKFGKTMNGGGKATKDANRDERGRLGL